LHSEDGSDSSPGVLPVRALQIWLSSLAALAALACGRALLLPPWPHAEPLPPSRVQARLAEAGFEPIALPPRSLPRHSGLGLSTQLAWRLPGVGELRLASVHVRRRDDFQVAWITRDIPSLSLQSRRLAGPGAEEASGRIEGRPAFQTCLVDQGASPARPAVSLTDLQAAVDRQPRRAGEQWRKLLGLRRTREFRCLLVTLKSPSMASPPQTAWNPLLKALQSLDSPP
jgi:hypothetical protein